VLRRGRPEVAAATGGRPQDASAVASRPALAGLCARRQTAPRRICLQTSYFDLFQLPLEQGETTDLLMNPYRGAGSYLERDKGDRALWAFLSPKS